MHGYTLFLLRSQRRVLSLPLRNKLLVEFELEKLQEEVSTQPFCVRTFVTHSVSCASRRPWLDSGTA